MLEAPLTASSIGTATFAATTCALAPTYVVVTVTVGGVIYGYCSRGSDRYDKAPMRTINSDIAIAKFGRWMKKWLSMAYGSPTRCGPWWPACPRQRGAAVELAAPG